MVSNGDPVALRQLSNTVNVSLAKAANRPLQSLSLNATQVGHPLSPVYCLGVHVAALRLFPVLSCAVLCCWKYTAVWSIPSTIDQQH